MIDYELFKRDIPKESIELIFINVKIRENLRSLWELYKSGNLEYNDKFEEIFNEMFKIFLRPLKLFSLETIKIPKTYGFLNAYFDFLRSYFEYLQSLFELIFKVITSLSDNPFKDWELYLENFQDVFILPKSAVQNLFRGLEEYERFVSKYDEFSRVLKESYLKACRRFIQNVKANDFDEFVNLFVQEISKEFDRVLKSENYVSLQKEMVESLMDYAYHIRRYFEDLIEYNPLNPFATISMIDEAYRRIQDLKRRVDRLERIVYGRFPKED